MYIIMNFNNIKIIKKLGAGTFGTTYLCEYKNNKYALKIEHILEKDKKKDFNNQLWREIDVYNYIDMMPKADQLFFTKMHAYEIFDDCKHQQIRSFKLDMNDKKNPFAQQLKKLDESTWCIQYLLDYKGKTNLGEFLIKYGSKLKAKQIYSIVLQIIHIMLLLKKGGYSHNDLHDGNVMITKTDKEYFILNNTKIPYYGYQLSAIDYGEVLNKKFGIKYKNYLKGFLKDSDLWLFNEMYNNVRLLIENISYLIHCCKQQKKKLPFPWDKNTNCFDDTLKKIICFHTDFFKGACDKYVKLFPKGEKLLAKIYNTFKTNKSKKTINEIAGKDKNINSLYYILDRIFSEFEILYPKLYKKYYGWCCDPKWLVPTDTGLEFLMMNTTDDLINFWISKI
jgi:serine/threonine protein kinase